MYREIIRPTTQKYMIEIPKEYLNKDIEILILPFSNINTISRNKKYTFDIDPMIGLQSSSMKKTWDNIEDEAWNEL